MAIISATLLQCVSPAAPPATVKSWLARCTSRPSIVAHPVTTPSAGSSFSAMPKYVARCWQNSPISSKLPRSTSRSTRSRAVSLPDRVLPLDALLAAAQFQLRALRCQLRNLVADRLLLYRFLLQSPFPHLGIMQKCRRTSPKLKGVEHLRTAVILCPGRRDQM